MEPRSAQRTAIAAVLRAAEHDPGGRLPYRGVAESAFTSRAELLLALQDEWTEMLRRELSVSSTDPERALRLAWRRAAASNPTLRALLDRHLAECGPALTAALDAQDELLAMLGLHRGDGEQLVTRQVA